LYKIFKSVTVHDTPVVIVTRKNKLICEDIVATADSDTATLSSDNIAQLEELASAHAEVVAQQNAQMIEQLRREGRDEGYQQGYREGLEQARQAIEDATIRAQHIVVTGEQTANQSLLAAEEQMVEIAMAVARKIIGRELIEHNASVIPLVRIALNKVQDQEKITIRVGPDNYEEVVQSKSEILSGMAQSVVLSIINDDGFKHGDCVVETPYGTIDARIDTQLDILKESLLDTTHE